MKNKFINNDQLIKYVINISKEVFSEKEQFYVQNVRINKLAILVAEDLANNDIEVKDFVWGYYRHGFYSPSIKTYINSEYNGRFNLNTAFHIDIDIPETLSSLMHNKISELRKFFIRDKKSFFDWIYTKKTPEEYRSFYDSTRKLSEWFENLDQDITHFDGFQTTLFNRLDRNISGIISNYYISLGYIHDDELLNILRIFTDLVEDLALQFNNGYNPSKVRLYLNRLNSIYDSILTIITPYTDTLRGDPLAISKEIENHNSKVDYFKGNIKNQLEELYNVFEEENILPKFEQMQKELHEVENQVPNGTMDLNEIYETLFDYQGNINK